MTFLLQVSSSRIIRENIHKHQEWKNKILQYGYYRIDINR